jgi:hypothetical protein
MKRRSPFTIVTRPAEIEKEVAKRLPKRDSRSELLLRPFRAPLRRALLSSAFGLPLGDLGTSGWGPSEAAAPRKKPSKVRGVRRKVGIARAAQASRPGESKLQSSRVRTIGLLDLGAWLSRLPELLKVMNGAQRRFAFLELQTPVPAGLVKTEEALVVWARKHGVKLTKARRSELVRNMLADEFFYFAESLRRRYSLDLLIGLTPAMVAFVERGVPHWNYYACGDGKTAVVSTADVREYARRGRRPYEAAVGMMVAAQVIALVDGIEYHPETRGCLFDFDEEREDLVVAIKKMRIDAECLALLKKPGAADSATALMAALSKMKEVRRG